MVGDCILQRDARQPGRRLGACTKARPKGARARREAHPGQGSPLRAASAARSQLNTPSLRALQAFWPLPRAVEPQLSSRGLTQEGGAVGAIPLDASRLRDVDKRGCGARRWQEGRGGHAGPVRDHLASARPCTALHTLGAAFLADLAGAFFDWVFLAWTDTVARRESIILAGGEGGEEVVWRNRVEWHTYERRGALKMVRAP